MSKTNRTQTKTKGNQTSTKSFKLSQQKQKQILARIAASNPQNQQDYKKIITSLTAQNTKLHNEVQVMSEQVLKLIEKTKVERPQQERMQKQIEQKKGQLNLKYKQFDQYKKQIEEIKAKNLDPQVNAKLINNRDLLKEINRQIEELQATKIKLTKYLSNNNQALKQYEDDKLPADLEQLIRQNKILKKKAQEQRRREEQVRHEQIKAQNNMINLKMKARKTDDKDYTQPPSTNLKVLKNEKIEQSEILNSTIYKAVQALKQKKRQIETKQQKQRIQKIKKRQQLFNHNQQLLTRMKALQMQKVKLRQQLNKYESYALEIQNSKKKDKDVKTKNQQSAGVQTDSKQSLLVLRRDYSGIVGKNRFDDRINVLGNNFSTKINRVIVYQNTKSIAAVKFEYFDQNLTSYETQMIVPLSYLNKCKKKSFQISKTNDFFKLFKIKFNSTTKRIMKIQIISNLNIKAEFGDKRPFEQLEKDQNVYGFDISINQLPVSMFGSINQVGNEWYLQSLGAEIKGFNQKIKVEL